MFRVNVYPIIILFVLALASCASQERPAVGMQEVEPAVVDEFPAASKTEYPAGMVERGRYMVTLLGCGNCHTDGALVGKPDLNRVLAGSDVGIAYSNPLEHRNPGVVYPANLTPDRETGLGAWTVEQIVSLLQSGTNNHGSQALPVMPWQAYSRLTPEDASAIAMYLKSIPPVKHEVPDRVRPGNKARHPYVHFGVYQSEQ